MSSYLDFVKLGERSSRRACRARPRIGLVGSPELRTSEPHALQLDRHRNLTKSNYIGMVDIGVVIGLDLFLLVVNILCFGKYGCLFFFVVGWDLIAVYGTKLSLLLGEVSVFGDVMFLILNFVEDTLFFITLYGTLICTFFAGSLYLDRGGHSSESWRLNTFPWISYHFLSFPFFWLCQN